MSRRRRLRDLVGPRTPRPSHAAFCVPRTAGVMLVRDAVDIAALVVAHHLAAGIERVHVIDDGSTDGTTEVLDELATRTDRVTFHRVFGVDDPQVETVSEACNRLIESGARLVIPFDADEFWDVTGDLLTRWVEDERPRRLTSSWVNFAQVRDHTYPRPGGLLSIRHRATTDTGATAENVGSFQGSFLQYGPVPKAIVWSQSPVDFGRGQHHVEAAHGVPALVEEPAGVDVMHVPLRWRSELTKRALNYEPRRARQRLNEGDSWQSLFHLRTVLEHREAEVWAANSVDDTGCLDVYGRSVQLERDDRLHRAVVVAQNALGDLGLPTP